MVLLAALLLAGSRFTFDQRVEDLIKQMTLDEKVSLCHGRGGFDTAPIERLGIPSYKFSDGPSGVRYPWNEPATCFTTGVSMAATFNPDLINRVGISIGEETLARGNAVILGPGVNIVRTPIGGRSFEYYGEDPYLARQTAVAYIKGVQSRGVAACVKHFAANSIEMQRDSVDAQIDERTLREIYLPAFEGAVKDAKVATIMAAYNKVNGHYSSENDWLQNQVLKKEWGFEGYVMSDWGAVHSTIPSAMSGMDLEMPGGPNNRFAKPLGDAVREGRIPETVVDDKVRRFLRVMLALDAKKPKRIPKVGSPAHMEVARQVTEEAMVLLKNDSGILPLKKGKLKSLLVIGPDADRRMSNGGGSAMVNAADETTPLQGIKNYLGAGVTVTHIYGSEPNEDEVSAVPASVLQTPDGKPGLTARYSVRGSDPVERIDPSIDFAWGTASPADKIPAAGYNVRWTGTLTPTESGSYFLGLKNDDGGSLIVDGKLFVDNSDGWGEHPSVRAIKPIELTAGKPVTISVNYRHHSVSSECRLIWAKTPGGVEALIQRAALAAKSADQTILVVGTNHQWDGEAHDKPSLKMYGDEEALTASVLAANPKTVVTLVNGTAIEMPWIANAHAVLEAWYGGSRTGEALASILFGDVNPSGKLPVSFPVTLADSSAHALGNYPPKSGVLKYDDGILVGYRWFDTKNVAPLFPFGYGLSYTIFAYSDVQASAAKDSVKVRFKLKNAGSRAGKETAQIYIRAKASSVPRAMQELKGYAKIALGAGASQEVTVTLPRSAFAYYSVEKHDWVVEPGQYEIAVGSSSRDIRGTASVKL